METPNGEWWSYNRASTTDGRRNPSGNVCAVGVSGYCEKKDSSLSVWETLGSVDIAWHGIVVSNGLTGSWTLFEDCIWARSGSLIFKWNTSGTWKHLQKQISTAIGLMISTVMHDHGSPVWDSRSGAPFPPNYNLSESCQYLSLNDNNPRWSSNQYPAHMPQLTLSSLLFCSASKKSLDLKGHLKMTQISILLLLKLLFPCGNTIHGAIWPPTNTAVGPMYEAPPDVWIPTALSRTRLPPPHEPCVPSIELPPSFELLPNHWIPKAFDSPLWLVELKQEQDLLWRVEEDRERERESERASANPGTSNSC